MKKYELTEEHRAQLKSHADWWIKNALSTKAMDDHDKSEMRKAIKGLYESANLVPPPDERIVFVSSPFVARFAGGFAAAIWWLRNNKKENVEAATEDATEDATWAATGAATRAATWSATWDATIAATRDATWDATRDATEAATRAATDAATRAATSITKNKWFNFSIKSMINLSINLKIGKFGLDCAYESSKMWNGGNQWSAYPSFLSFFRYVAKLDIDYTKWDYYEKAAIHAGHRIMHEKFCIISDRPEILKIDEQNRPHSFDGPFCRWRDGSALYSIHGIRVPMWICETKKEDFTKEMIVNETNADNRRCIIQKIGIEKAIELLGADVIDSYESPIGGKYELLQIDYDGRGKRCYLKMKSKSIDAYHIEGIKPGITTVKEAIAYRNGLDKFEEPEILT